MDKKNNHRVKTSFRQSLYVAVDEVHSYIGIPMRSWHKNVSIVLRECIQPMMNTKLKVASYFIDVRLIKKL